MARPRILVVEDEAIVARDLQRRLQGLGYDVPVTSATGEHAIAQALEWRPELILMDIRLKGEIDGVEAALRIRRTFDIPVIFLTAYADANTLDRAKITEPFGYILKPFEDRELHLAIQIALHKHQIESELRRSERWLAGTLRAISDAVIAVDSQSEIVFMNPVAEALTGCAQKDAVGRKVADIFETNGATDGLTWAALSGALRSSPAAVVTGEGTLVTAGDGKRFQIDPQTASIRDENGTVTGAVLVFRDITDLVRAHEEQLAKEKMETVGTLASGIAHDFNNLLGGVLASSELALAGLAEGSKSDEELKRIRDAAIRGAEIVRQLLVYAGEETEALELVDVSRIVKDMLELLKVSVSKHVSVETDLGDRLPAVRANPSQVRQVVMNLFTNASEAIGDRDGVIRATTSRVKEGVDSSAPTSKRPAAGGYVQLEVSDTGRGMTPEVQARIFDVFFSTKPAGVHGLGLAGVRGIVQRCHGIIRVSSVPGKGTTFRIRLPSEEQTDAAIDSPAAKAGNERPGSPGRTILFVEDEDLLRKSVSKMLRKNGLFVVEAADGSAALEAILARKDDIDVLLLDITLPGASSRTVYEEVRRLRPNVPVIVTSAKSEEVSAKSLGTGIERFLRKPYEFDDLIGVIRETLSSHGLDRASPVF